MLGVRSQTADKWGAYLTYQSRSWLPGVQHLPFIESSWLAYPASYHILTSPGLGFPSPSFSYSYIIQPFLSTPVFWPLVLLASWSEAPTSFSLLFLFLPLLFSPTSSHGLVQSGSFKTPLSVLFFISTINLLYHT